MRLSEEIEAALTIYEGKDAQYLSDLRQNMLSHLDHQPEPGFSAGKIANCEYIISLLDIAIERATPKKSVPSWTTRQ